MAVTEMGSDLGFRAELASAASQVGLTLHEDQLERMVRFQRLVLYRNQRMNLTRIVEDREMAVKHFVDSLVLVSASDTSTTPCGRRQWCRVPGHPPEVVG